MVNTILTTYGRLLENYLSSFFHQPEGLVEVAPITQDEEEPNKLLISLLNIERETTQGISSKVSRSGGRFSASYNPYIHANLYIILSAVYRQKRYRESLSIISQSISFLQSTPTFDVGIGQKYTIEMVSLSWQDQSNIWTGFGGKYYPSFVCKIRGVTFDANQIQRIMPDVREADTTLD